MNYINDEIKLVLDNSEHFYDYDEIIFARNRCSPDAITINLDKRLVNPNQNSSSSKEYCIIFNAKS